MITFPFAYGKEDCELMHPISYSQLAAGATAAKAKQSANDSKRVILLAIDVQGTFCVPTGELFVGGAPADTSRLIRFVEGNFEAITHIACTLDTHKAFQIFHPAFLVDADGKNPPPFTPISHADVVAGRWRIAPSAAYALLGSAQRYNSLQAYLLHYTSELTKGGRYDLFVWPYHAMLGGINHALVSAWESACFFHGVARGYNTTFETKGGQLPENYSVLRPEVLTGVGGSPLCQKNTHFFQALMSNDAVIIAGQAKSHCVAWTIDDLIAEVKAKDPKMLAKIFLLEDCTSSVGGFEKQGNDAFDRFRSEGVNIISHTTDVRSLV